MNVYSSVLRNSLAVSEKLRSMAINPTSVTTVDFEECGKFSFIVYFADTTQMIYQLVQWLKSLEGLAAANMSVLLVVKSPAVAKQLLTQTSLPILVSRSMEEIEDIVERREVAGVFYVNNSQANFTALRMTRPTHIHLSHGESEKASMVSNQLKAYDYAFIAGDAAEQRILSNIKRIDPSHLVKIGRPQLDLSTNQVAGGRTHSKIVVLYAPTWEGDSKSMDYSSLTRLGSRLVKELLADERLNLVFRPHPKTGSWSRDAAKSLRRVTGLIKQAAPEHQVDLSSESSQIIADSDVVITDVSAMAMDAIGLHKRLLVIDTASQTSVTSAAMLLEAIPSTTSDYSGNFLELVLGLVNQDIASSQVEYRDHVFGSLSLGTGTDRFIAAAERVLSDSRS